MVNAAIDHGNARVASAIEKRPGAQIHARSIAVNTPMVSQLVRMVERIRFSSAMHLTVKSGISVERAMQYSSKVIKNSVLQASGRCR